VNNDVTLLSAIKDDEVELFSLNHYSVQRFNPDSEHKTVLVNNTSGNVSGLDGVDIVPGINVDLIAPLLIKPVSDEVGLVLMMGLRAVDTRYICVLDPDFFVICPFWIEAMKTHMEATDVGIITAPPFPLHSNKRNTVTNSFIFIDTERFPKALINFLPSKRDVRWNSVGKIIASMKGHMLYHYFRKNVFLDCGDQIEMRSETKIEYLIALYNHKRSPYHTWFERIIPERFRLINTNVPYLPFSKLDTNKEIWLWNGIPFGIHCRKYFQKSVTKGYTAPINSLRQIISNFLRGYKLAIKDEL